MKDVTKFFYALSPSQSLAALRYALEKLERVPMCRQPADTWAV